MKYFSHGYGKIGQLLIRCKLTTYFPQIPKRYDLLTQKILLQYISYWQVNMSYVYKIFYLKLNKTYLNKDNHNIRNRQFLAVTT